MRLVNKFLLLAVFAVSAAAQAELSEVYGYWGDIKYTVNGFNNRLSFEIGADFITAFAECKYKGQTLNVSTTSPAVITETTITTSEATQNTVGDEKFNCNVSTSVGTLMYELMSKGKKIVLTIPEDPKHKMTLKRLKTP